MKLLYLATLITLPFFAIAQDTILKRDGEKIQAKVLEVSTEEVKYKKFEHQDGPTYAIKKAELLSVTYKDGSEDVFKTDKNSTKRMFVWSPNIKRIELPKSQITSAVSIFVQDNRATPPKRSIVEFSSDELVVTLSNSLRATGIKLQPSESKEAALINEIGLFVSIDAYDVTFYPGMWHAQTRYFVQIAYKGAKHQKEIESLKNAFNSFGQATAKAQLTKSYEEATSQIVEFLNSIN